MAGRNSALVFTRGKDGKLKYSKSLTAEVRGKRGNQGQGPARKAPAKAKAPDWLP